MRIATFNAQNLRLRERDGHLRLDGARDRDEADQNRAQDQEDRKLSAAVLASSRADVIALQEVFDRATLDFFHDRYLVPAGVAPYPHRICQPGNDGHGLDVAMLSRLAPDTVDSTAHLTPADLGIAPATPNDLDRPVFRRDCLIARFGPLTLFNCHFKAPYPDPQAAWPVRRMEAEAVRKLILQRFPDPGRGLWMVLGDLNEPRDPVPDHRPAIAPLLDGLAVDLLERVPAVRRWSYFDPHSGRYSRPDAFLASAALAARFPDVVPQILRQGLGYEASRDAGRRIAGVGFHRPHASDHAALVVEFPGLLSADPD